MEIHKLVFQMILYGGFNAVKASQTLDIRGRRIPMPYYLKAVIVATPVFYTRPYPSKEEDSQQRCK